MVNSGGSGQNGPIEGGCVCGAIAFQVSGSAVRITYAGHKTGIAAAVMYYGFPASSYRQTTSVGPDITRIGGVTHYACPRCRTDIAYVTARWGDDIQISASTLQQATIVVEQTAHQVPDTPSPAKQVSRRARSPHQS